MGTAVFRSAVYPPTELLPIKPMATNGKLRFSLKNQLAPNTHTQKGGATRGK
jgi:hypothetical protein